MKTLLLSVFVLFQMCAQEKKDSSAIIKNVEEKESKMVIRNIDTLSQKITNQNTYMKVIYNETLNLPDDIIAKLPEEVKKEFKKPIVYNLYYDGNNSSYTIASNPKGVTVKDLENTNNSNSFTITEFAVYKDYSKNMIISKTELIKKQYLINKPFYTEKWVLKNEFKKIGDLNCKRAEIILNNEKIIAYYSEEIPISEGPSIYFGLPGLIIHLEAPDRIYSMSKFEKLTDVKIEKFKNGIEITDKEFKILASKTQKSTEIIENN